MVAQFDIRGHGIGAAPLSANDNTIPLAPLRIGAGQCGSVWTTTEATWVLKKADGSAHRYLWKEYYIQNRILNHCKPSKALIQECFWYSVNEGLGVMCSEHNRERKRLCKLLPSQYTLTPQSHQAPPIHPPHLPPHPHQHL